MDTISRLRELLFRALSSPEPQHEEQELFDQLMLQKPRLLQLFDVGPQSQQEQKEIESGKPTINGKPTAVNADFARQAVFLAQQLGCSEKYVAGVLHHVTSQNPNIEAIPCMELAVSTFHQRRRHLVESLRFLMEVTEAAELPDAPSTYKSLARFVISELLPGTRTMAGQMSLAHKILREIEQLDAVIGRGDNARKNAGSNTVPPTGQGTPSLGFDTLNARYDSLKYERRYLAIVLCFISRLGYFSAAEVKLVMEWLSTNQNNPITYYMLTSALLSFDPIDPSNHLSTRRASIATDQSLMTFMIKKFEPSAQWKEPGLKAAVLLKWTMFLTEARHNDSTLEHRGGFKNEELETQVWNAVQGDAFLYLARVVLHIRGTESDGPAGAILDDSPIDQLDQREVPSADFKPIILSTFETLVRSLITHASSELRKIKQRQEDLVLATARTDRRNVSRFSTNIPVEPEKKPGTAPRHDIAILYTFIGILFSALPEERALQFWGSSPGQSYRTTYQEAVESTSGRLPLFVQWAVWSTSTQDTTMLSSLYDMLCGLAHGQQCSELAYNFLARGGVEIVPGSTASVSSNSPPTLSWTVIFGTLESWATHAANPRSQPQSQPLGMSTSFTGSIQNLASQQLASSPSQQQFMIGPKDVILARSFLRILATVVSHSVAVRTTIAGHGQFRAIPVLLSLIPLGIPLELKGALFETLSAFCEPGAGAAGIEICKSVWTMMERLEVINVRLGPSAGMSVSLATGKGVEVELEQVEAAHRVYPATIAFLKLLTTLIHTPKQISLQDRATGAEPLNTIPDNLGQPYRMVGIAPFTSFVIDNVFNNIPNREYSQPSDRWKINDLCLNFIERSLASFNLESLVAGLDDGPLKMETVTPLLIHPGFDVMKRLLTTTALQTTILSYIVEGLAGFEKGLADEDVFFRNTIVRVLRIVYRVLEIQDIFLDVFVPLLQELNGSVLVGQAPSRSSFTRFDQALTFAPRFIPAIAAYVSYPSHPELVYLSVRIMSRLSTSTSPASLVPLIERSTNSDRILSGFMQIMTSDSTEDAAQAEEYAEQTTGAGAPTMDIPTESLEQATRLAALNLIIQDTESSRPYPNLAHFLLFGSRQGEYTIQDPHALGAQQTSIHVLLELINAGVPRVKGKRKEKTPTDSTEPLFLTLPDIAERMYRVVYQLCIHPRTSEFTARYLRTREDFFARQIARIPLAAPESIRQPLIQVLYADGARITTNVSALSSFLALRSYIFDLVALELHVLTNRGHFKGVTELLEILFGADFDCNDEDQVFPTFHELGQSPMRIVDFLQSLMFDWADSLSVEQVDLKYLGQFNPQPCMRKDKSGCEVVDRTAVLYLLASARRTLHSNGTIATQSQNEQLNKEFNYILESCAVENHRRKVSYARACGFDAWRRLLDLALMKCFDRLPHNRRENMLFDLLHVLPAAIRSPNIEEPTAILLSETVLSSVTKLREDRHQQLILQSVDEESESGSLPAERLFNILRHILEGIMESNHVELVRGNLYASLINFFHLIRSSSPNQITFESESNPFAASLSMSMMRDVFSSSRSRSVTPSHSSTEKSSGTPLEVGSLGLLKPHMEKLVSVISRDAVDGTEVWKTVAFMLLDATVQLSSLEKPHVALSALSRHGMLANFVRSLKDSDGRLQAVLKPDPEELNALYVYEAKMSLFIRMSQTRIGAERLLDAHLLPVLAACDYLDARPEADQAFIDYDSFLPSAIQRYHQLFLPALQVVDGVLATLGSRHSTATHQALDFLSNHSATIAILLKNESEYVSLATLEEIHLIIALCTSVLPSVPKADLLSANTGFGAIHLAILGLSTRCLGRGRPFPHVVPQSDEDVQLSGAHAFGYGSMSKFDLKVERKETVLRKTVVAYIGAAAEFTEPEITLVLSPVTVAPRKDEHAHFAATVPTVGDALVALDNICTELAETLKQISDISAELANKDQIGLDNAQEVLRDVDTSILRTLSTHQKRVLIAQNLQRILVTSRSDAQVQLSTLEMLMLLIWRHLEQYAEPSSMNVPPAKMNVSNAMRLLVNVGRGGTAGSPGDRDPEAFRRDVRTKIGPVLSRIGGLDLSVEGFGKEWQDSRGYIEIMCRRLKDSAGLHDELAMLTDRD
ncbi:nucleoporin Nup186/Nup192/Nup205 [Panaeolus papilionaceus]|nr:nucleoporin Nup186/Nup192/Nup205 [Panaeolus papilionaceus]